MEVISRVDDEFEDDLRVDDESTLYRNAVHYGYCMQAVDAVDAFSYRF